MIIRGTIALKAHYHELGPGDTVVGIVSNKALTQMMLIDLMQRGVRCLPPPLAQTLHSSKAAQAQIYRDVMLPHTLVALRRIDLVHAITHYNRHNIGALVTKEDHMHCGHGIRQWENIEVLYSHIGLSADAFPLVIQPRAERFTDVRVIMAGDYHEAYMRQNPHNLRQNLAVGGASSPCELNEKLLDFCRQVMKRGNFPYAHIDLMLFDDESCCLAEIALNGGIKGAAIARRELEQRKQAILDNFICINHTGGNIP